MKHYRKITLKLNMHFGANYFRNVLEGKAVEKNTTLY